MNLYSYEGPYACVYDCVRENESESMNDNVLVIVYMNIYVYTPELIIFPTFFFRPPGRGTKCGVSSMNLNSSKCFFNAGLRVRLRLFGAGVTGVFVSEEAYRYVYVCVRVMYDVGMVIW